MPNYNSILQLNNDDLQEILEIIEGLPEAGTGVELPNAEEAAFGSETECNEYGILTFVTSGTTSGNTLGYEFVATEAFSIIGIRNKLQASQYGYTTSLCLWNANGEAVRTISLQTEQTDDWMCVYFDFPVNVSAGEKYTVSAYCSGVSHMAKSLTFNPKLTNIRTVWGTGNSYPSNEQFESTTLVDIIIGPVSTEMPIDYQVKRITMDDIAEEVQRITATETKLSIAQIQSGLESVVLQDKIVASSSQDMIVTPDAAYYGLSSVTVEALPSAEDENFGGVDNTNEYVVQGETMDNIAKAIQNKKDTTAIFTPEQMAVEIEGIVVGNNLPEAEYASFGNSTLEYGKDKTSVSMQSGTEKDSVGYKFTPKEAFAVYGLYAYATTGSYVQLWDEDAQTLLAEVQIPDGTTEEVMLPAPINVIPGKNYIVCCYSTSRAFTTSATPTFSDKFTVKAWGFSSEGRSICPNYSSTGGMIGSADIIIGKAITESTVQEYKIQVETLDSIASEVQRITGTEATMSPAQIITALQGMAVQTAE